MNAPASIGNEDINYEFALNPDSVQWSYKEITQAYDTLGGRVIQLLAVEVGAMTVQGSLRTKRELQQFASAMAKIMRYHVNSGGKPVHFRVPSRQWDFLVYVSKVPSIGWDTQTVAFPWTLELKVEEDLGIVTETILNAELDALAKGIGYSDLYHGGDFLGEGFRALLEQLAAGAAGTG